MHIELINTGSELMLGRVLNTHQQWLCRELADRGYVVQRQLAVPDTAADIQAAVREALAVSDLVIVTGGLGPTSDDITRDFIAQLLGKPLREDPAILAHLQAFFASRGRPMPESTKVQAQVPEGALVLPNGFGTAPGLAMEVKPNPFQPHGTSWVIMLPGPPRELRPMFLESVVPLLQRVLPPEEDFVCHTLRTSGLGESLLEERIRGSLADRVAAGLELGYCARPGQVDVRLAAHGAQASALIAESEKIVRQLLEPWLYAEESEEIEVGIVRLLRERKLTLALAESCTGGNIAHRITNVPGASEIFLAGLVTYSNAAKEKFLGVKPATLAAHGAVSEEVAREMVGGVRQATGADFGIAVTGIAGPSGGTPEKPVGTVYIGLGGAFGSLVKRFQNPFERETFKQVTCQQALEMLRRAILHPSSATEKRD